MQTHLFVLTELNSLRKSIYLRFWCCLLKQTEQKHKFF